MAGRSWRTIQILLTIALAASPIAPPLAAQTDRPSAEQELARIGRLPRAQQIDALTALLRSKDLDSRDPEEFAFQLLGFRQPLAELANKRAKQDKDILRLVTYLGEPTAVRQALKQLPEPGAGEIDHDLAEAVVGQLIHPATEKEWNLLAHGAEGELGGGATHYAIQSLKLNASPRARALLEAALIAHPERRKVIEDALNYIRSGATPLEGTDLISLATRAANAVKRGELLTVRAPRVTADGQRAIAGFDYHWGCRYSNIALFHRTGRGWRLQSTTITGVALTPPAPPPPPNR